MDGKCTKSLRVDGLRVEALRLEGLWVEVMRMEALPPTLTPSLRAVADGAAIQTPTNLPTRPCEAQRAEAIQTGRIERSPALFLLGCHATYGRSQ